ncbi:MAG: hypothetical protein ABFR36_03150 [Acidobacteriota bacterium]
MKKIFLLIFAFAAITIPASGTASLYELSYEISGSAKGTILLIFPYRVYYSSAASLIFSTSYAQDGKKKFSLQDINGTGHMIRTLGFSGRSLGIMTADNDKSKGKELSIKLKNGFSVKAPEYSKYIKKSFWNNLLFKKVKGSIKFSRTPDGISSDLKYNLWLKRSSGEKPLRINFNIYRILGEVIKSNKHSFLPENKKISYLINRGNMKWTSGKIDFSEMLARSALYAASIFKKIKRLKQEKPFYAEFFSRLSDKGELIIKGVAEPEVSVWRSFRIKKYIREVRIRVKGRQMISDKMIIEVYNDTGKGGRLTTTLKLKGS